MRGPNTLDRSTTILPSTINGITGDQQSVMMLPAGHIDAVIGTESYLDYLIASEGYKGAEKAPYDQDP